MLKAVKYKFDNVPNIYWDFADRHGAIYQTKSYIECLVASDVDLFMILVYDGDELKGGTVVQYGRKILNFPINARIYFGPVVQHYAILKDILMVIGNAVKRDSLLFTINLPAVPTEALSKIGLLDGVKKTVEFLHWDISRPLADLRKSFGKGNKSGINRAQKEGVIVVDIKTEAQVDQFYDVYSMSMNKSSLDPENINYFKSLIFLLRPKGLAAGFLALHPRTKEAIAGRMLLLGTNGGAVFLASGHDPKYRKLRGGNLLMWRCLEFLKSRNFRTADFVGLPKGNTIRTKGLRDSKLSWVGNYGHHHLSLTLTHGNFGLNPKLIIGASLFLKRLLILLRGIGLQGLRPFFNK